jgi:hypothetical protein
MVKNIATLNKSKSPDNLIVAFNKLPPSLNNAIIGKTLKSMTPHFVLTFEIFNINVHNLLIEYGASYNVIPYAVCNKINVES